MEEKETGHDSCYYHKKFREAIEKICQLPYKEAIKDVYDIGGANGYLEGYIKDGKEVEDEHMKMYMKLNPYLKYQEKKKHDNGQYCICTHYIEDRRLCIHVPTNQLMIVGNRCIMRTVSENNRGAKCILCRAKIHARNDIYCKNCKEKKVLHIKNDKKGYDNMPFSHIAKEDPEYCEWVKTIKRPSKSFIIFQNWLENDPEAIEIKNNHEGDEILKPSKDAVLTFGPYKGKTYQQVVDLDKTYCRWMANDETKWNMTTGQYKFISWVNENYPTLLFDTEESKVKSVVDNIENWSDISLFKEGAILPKSINSLPIQGQANGCARKKEEKCQMDKEIVLKTENLNENYQQKIHNIIFKYEPPKEWKF